MSHEEATRLLNDRVDAALDAGLQGEARPEVLGFGFDRCNSDLLGPADQARPAISYEFPLSSLGGAAATFADNAARAWETEGMTVTSSDDPGIIRRFATSEDGFNFQVTVHQGEDFIFVGGSGPCVDPPVDALD